MKWGILFVCSSTLFLTTCSLIHCYLFLIPFLNGLNLEVNISFMLFAKWFSVKKMFKAKTIKVQVKYAVSSFISFTNVLRVKEKLISNRLITKYYENREPRSIVTISNQTSTRTKHFANLST